jgi:hypothetical protein
MRYAARCLFAFAAATSLLLFIAIVICWLRSYFFSDLLRWTTATGQTALCTRQGHLVLHLFRADWSNQPARMFGLKYDQDLPAPPSQDLFVRLMLGGNRGDKHTYWEGAGFAWWHYRRLDGVRSIIAVAPFWSLALATAALPLTVITRYLRTRRRNARQKHNPIPRCQSCGYDLRATPTRCPECGTPAPINRP